MKTRLSPELSPIESAEVAKVLLEETLKLTTKSWPSKVVLAVWPNLQNDFIQTMLFKYPVDSIIQVEGDLGEKMFAAMQSSEYPCAVMGCDVPHLPVEYLKKAYKELEQGQNVIGPTDDGGYYFLGLQQTNTTLFSDQDWGREKVLQNSLEKAKQD